jgi:hypothetical protein
MNRCGLGVVEVETGLAGKFSKHASDIFLILDLWKNSDKFFLKKKFSYCKKFQKQSDLFGKIRVAGLTIFFLTTMWT